MAALAKADRLLRVGLRRSQNGHEKPVVAFSQFAPEQSLSLMSVLDRSGMFYVSKLMDA
jgi:hypothetical protein